MEPAKPVTALTEQEAKAPSAKPKSFIETIPWTGLVSLATMVLCTIVSAAVVGVSQDKLAESWSVSPAVILAIISAISNIAFNSAMATGIAVRFWLYASKDSHLSQLHYIWDHGRGFGFISALRAGSEARTVSLLATIAYITQFASGPLLQRSVDQTVKMLESSQDLYMDVATHIPDGWLGQMENDRVMGYLNGIPQQQAVWRNITMHTRMDHAQPGYNCYGTCHGYVQGAGFAHRCSTTETHLDMIDMDTNDAVVFEINGTRAVNSTGDPYLLLTTLYASDVNTSCVSTITIRTCEIDAGIVEYPVTVSNNTITLRTDELTSMKVVSTYTSPLDLPAQPDQGNSGPLGGLEGLVGGFGDVLYNQATKKYNPDISRTRYSGTTTIADLFIQVQGPAYADDEGPMRKCALTWASPTDYVLRYMHEFAFRSALRIGMNGTATILATIPQTDLAVSPHRQTLRMTRHTPLSLFVISGVFLGAGIATMVLALALVASLMWGWWRLRRSVTLSPLETVSALVDAPELRDMPPDTTLRQILSRVDSATAAATTTGSIRPGASGSGLEGLGLRKTMTGTTAGSSSVGFRPGPLRKVRTFGGGGTVIIKEEAGAGEGRGGQPGKLG